MKQTKNILLAGLSVVAFWLSTGSAQTNNPTEVVANLLSVIKRSENPAAADTFQVSFGSLNGGLASLLNKDQSANGAQGFSTWYAANSRTLLNWGTVVGADIQDLDSYYKYYGVDTSVSTYAGGPLNSIWSSSLDNRALAFVTASSGGVVQEIGLYDMGFNWTSPTDPIAVAFGLSENWSLLAHNFTAVYGSLDTSTELGTITTSTVPEPTSGSLMLLGTAGVLALRRLRKTNV